MHRFVGFHRFRAGQHQPPELRIFQLLLPAELRIQSAHCPLLLPQAAKTLHRLLLLPQLLLLQPQVLLSHAPQPPVQNFPHSSVELLLVLSSDQSLKVLLLSGVESLFARFLADLRLLFFHLHGVVLSRGRPRPVSSLPHREKWPSEPAENFFGISRQKDCSLPRA